MQVLKIVAEGVTTSFRRPHFMHGIQPTFHMPPPATIYGHICSALGELVSPDAVAFAYHFTAQQGFSDIEHTHIVAESSGKLKNTAYPKVLEGGIQPFKREILFQPRLTLYLNRPDWIEAFRHPCYAVVLGRSQDLFTYTSIEQIDLQPAASAYFEHTLLPYSMAVRVGRGITELLPRYLDYKRKRTPTFARYLLLENRVMSSDFWPGEMEEEDLFWIDPTSPSVKTLHLGLVFHTFVGEAYEAITMA
ncbi:MAG TPA: CRISPR-associated protein Cas5 [Ktedonobacteraceae bacterium]|nr:CRISPR-associated protein Cas5 [Ktedonobacteraceae bacterium]